MCRKKYFYMEKKFYIENLFWLMSWNIIKLAPPQLFFKCFVQVFR